MGTVMPRPGAATQRAGFWIKRCTCGILSLFEEPLIEFGGILETSGAPLSRLDLWPRPFLYFRETGNAAGAFATHIDDILGRGGPGVLPKLRGF